MKSLNDNKEKLTEIFTAYIRSGIKMSGDKSLGVEVEHFVLDDKTLGSVPYSGEGGVKESVEKLMSLYPGAEAIVGEDFLGFTAKEFNVTLEPAAQIEISIIQSDDIELIGNIYRDFYDKLTGILKPLGQHLCTVGCQPVSHVDDLELIPKGRYRLMDAHFKKTGTGGREMMRGTASTQVSVDYTSEEDFRRKLQAAYYYMPLIKLVSDRVETFQGEKVNVRLKRTDIWNRTDPARCGVLPGVFKPDYGFKDYAEYLCSVPLIFLPEEGGERYTEFAAAPDLFKVPENLQKNLEGHEEEDYPPNDTQQNSNSGSPERVMITRNYRDHVFSMPFPDVRVKRYLEIRGADAMPAEGVMFLCALVKGLMYSEDVLDHVQERIKEEGLDEDSVRDTETSLMQMGWEGRIYGIPAKDFLSDTLKRCEKNLSEEEKKMIYGWDIL